MCFVQLRPSATQANTHTTPALVTLNAFTHWYCVFARSLARSFLPALALLAIPAVKAKAGRSGRAHVMYDIWYVCVCVCALITALDFLSLLGSGLAGHRRRHSSKPKEREREREIRKEKKTSRVIIVVVAAVVVFSFSFLFLLLSSHRREWPSRRSRCTYASRPAVDGKWLEQWPGFAIRIKCCFRWQEW